MNSLKKLFSVFTCLTVGIGYLIAGDAIAGTLITAIAEDDDTFTQTTTTTRVQNGDFLIRNDYITRPHDRILGDGKDELTEWDFDFNNNLFLGDFVAEIQAGAGLKQALLTFELTPNGGVQTDTTRIDARNIAGDLIVDRDEMQSLGIASALLNERNNKVIFTLDLLGDNLIDESALIDAFFLGKLNTIPWRWNDDVLIHSTTLTLETAIPEPTTILGLLALGTFGVRTIKRKKEST